MENLLPILVIVIPDVISEKQLEVEYRHINSFRRPQPYGWFYEFWENCFYYYYPRLK